MVPGVRSYIWYILCPYIVYSDLCPYMVYSAPIYGILPILSCLVLFWNADTVTCWTNGRCGMKGNLFGMSMKGIFGLRETFDVLVLLM